MKKTNQEREKRIEIGQEINYQFKSKRNGSH